MKENVKKGLITTLTLGAIVLGAGAIIGVTSAITSPFVVAHSEAAILASVKEVFPDADDLGTVTEFDSGTLSARYEARKGDTLIGWAYVGSGKNDYGQITATVGVESDGSLGRVAITRLDQTQPDQVRDYVEEVNDGSRPYTDTACGSTYGANVIRDIISAALDDAATLGGASEDLVLVRHVFPDATSVGELTAISGETVNGRYDVSDASGLIGYAFTGHIVAISEQYNVLAGINADGTLNRIYMVDFAPVDPFPDEDWHTALDNTYIAEVNDGSREPDDTLCGATESAKAFYAFIQECQSLVGGSEETPSTPEAGE